MDAGMVEATLKAHIAEMRQRLDQAAGIAKAARPAPRLATSKRPSRSHTTSNS
jgi:hypothetical protein